MRFDRLHRAATLLGAVLVACSAGHSATVSPPTTASAVTTEPVSTAPPVTRPAITAIADCSPVPQAVGAPGPGEQESLGPAVVFFEEAVRTTDRSRVIDGIRAAQRYLEESLDGFRFDEPICFDVRAGAASGTTVGVVYGANHIVLYAGAPSLAGAPGWLLSHVSAHEYVHFWQKDLGSPREALGPTWLLEGSAELLAQHAIVAAGLAGYDETRAHALRRLAPDAATLESMERRSPSSDEFSYPLAFLASEFLTAGPGLASLREYWRSLARGVTWEAAFTAAFGLPPSEFYVRFQEHRRRGFPN